MQRRRMEWSAVLLATVLFAACSGADRDATDPDAHGSFGLSLSSNTVSVFPGASETVDVALTRSGAFAGAVTMSAEGLPTGMTASFEPAILAVGASATTITFAAVTNTTPGTYTFTIRGRAAGMSDQIATATLTISHASVPILTLSPATLSVAQRATLRTTLQFARLSLPSPIAIAVSGAPAGVTVSLASSSLSNEGSTEMTVVVDSTSTVGSYPLRVTASSGTVTLTAAITLTIQPQP